MSQDWPGQEITGTPRAVIAPQPAPQQPSPPPVLRPVLSVPADPLEQASRQASIAGNEAQVQNTTHDNALADREARIKYAQTLRTEFNQKPAMTAYQTVLQAAAAALKADPTPTGDQQLITAYAKAMDPNSVVREGEFDTVANADSAAGRLWAKIQKEGGFDNAGLLRPEVRERVKKGLLNLADTGAQTYEQQRSYYSDLAKRNGLDPFEVVGPDIGEPFKPTIDAFRKQLEPAKDPTNRDIYKNGVKLAGSPGDGGSFNRDEYLASIGIDPGKEALVIGFWNANKGNTNLTPDAVKQWYAGQNLPPPDDAAIATAIGHAQKGETFQGFDTTAAEKAYHDHLDALLAARGKDPESMSGAVGVNAAEGLTLGGLDEAAGVGGFLAGGSAGYQVERDAIRREQERANAAHPVAGPVSEFAGSLVTAPIGMGGVATVADAAKAAGAVGAVGGFLHGEGAADSALGAGMGGATGAAFGAAGQKAAEALAARAAAKAAARAGQPATEGGEVIAAADRLNNQFGTDIQPTPADVGSPGVRNLTAGAAKMPLSAQPIIKAGQRVTQEAEKAKQAIASLAGTPTTGEEAAETALTGAQKYIKTSKTKVDSLYAKARQLGGDQPVDLAEARAALDQNIAELSQTPGGAKGLAELKALRAELDKPYPVEGVKGMRTQLRDKFASDGLRSSDIERRVGQVADAAEQDVITSLQRAGKQEAANAYAKASDAHAERVGVIDNVLAPIIGKNGDKSVEDVMKALDTATKTKGARLGKFLSALPKEDAGTVRASLINRLGMVSNGRQDAAGTVFSLNDFLTHWNNLSDTAKGQMFGGELRASLNDLAKVAEGTKGAQQYGNFSNTGTPLGLVGTTSIGSIGMVTHPFIATAVLASQYGGGKLLASPAFARWLAKMPKNPALAGQHIRSLSKIASADATISADVLGLQRALENAFSTTPAKLAAQPNTETSTTGAETQ